MAANIPLRMSWNRFYGLLGALLLTNPEGRPFPSLYLVGDTGIGKNTVIANLSTTLGIPSTIVNLSGAEPSDIQGLLRVQGDQHRWTLPYFFTEADEDWRARGSKDPIIAELLGDIPREKLPSRIILLDELGRVNSDVHNPLMNFILSHELHGKRLPERVLVIAAGNMPGSDEERFHVQAIDDAQRARLRMVEIVPHIDEWAGHATLEGVHEGVIQFVRDQPGLVRVWNTDHKGVDLRALTELGVRLKRMTPELFQAMGSSFCLLFLPTEVASALHVTLEASFARLIPEEVLFGYDRYRSKVQGLIEKRELSQIHAVIEKIPTNVHVLKQEEKEKAFSNLTEFVKDIPKELFVVFFERCLDEIASSETMADLIDELGKDEKIMQSVRTFQAEVA